MQLDRRLDNYENQSRRQNIKITGLKVGSEGKDPVTFFEKWIPEVLDMQQDRVKIERAHHTGPALGEGEKSGLEDCKKNIMHQNRTKSLRN